MVRLIKLAISLAVPLLGAITANVIASTAIGNLLDKFVGDYKLEVLFVLFTTVFQSLVSFVNDVREEKTAKLKLIFSDSADPENLNNEQTIILDEETSVGKVYCIIKFDGNSKYLKDLKIKIEFPRWVDAQVESNEEVEVVNYRTCYINCSKMQARSNDSVECFEHNVKIMMIGRGYSREDFKSVKVTSELVGSGGFLEKILFKFKTNNFILQS